MTGTAAAAVFLCVLAVSAVILNREESAEQEPAASEAKEENTAAEEISADDAVVPEEEPELSEEELLELEAEEILASMTLEEKAAQLFVVTPEAITGVETVVQAGTISQESIDRYPVGGLVFFSANLESESQTRQMLANFQAYSEERIGLPLFLCVDEEGGTVARVANNENFDVTDVGNMSDIADAAEAAAAGQTIGTYLSELGFNVDFAPVADVWTNPTNTVVQYRSFGSSAELVAELAASFLEGLGETGVYGTYKHFPGHGDTTDDTHEGYAYSEKTLEELWECEFLPFQEGIAQGVSFIMAAHISLPNVTGDDTPASMSPEIISLLRDDLGYEGIIITDALNMGAITEEYTSAQAAVTALKAGVDMLLMPADFVSAYQGVLDAVASGDLSEDRIDESVMRILRVKLSME